LTTGYVDGTLFYYHTGHSTILALTHGYEHPSWGVVASPYRSLDCNSASARMTGTVFLPCMGRRVPVARKDRILSVLRPEDAFTRLPSPLRRVIVDFVEALGVGWAGLTGSWAAGCGGRSSDVDIMVFYDEDLPRALSDMKSAGLISQCKTSLVKEKRGTRPDIGVDQQYIEESLLDSCYRGTPYTLRPITRLEETDCARPRTPLGRVRVRGVIVEGERFRVPSRYTLKISYSSRELPGKTLILESWRTRYQELPPGWYTVIGDLYYEDDVLLLTPDHGGLVLREGSR